MSRSLDDSLGLPSRICSPGLNDLTSDLQGYFMGLHCRPARRCHPFLPNHTTWAPKGHASPAETHSARQIFKGVVVANTSWVMGPDGMVSYEEERGCCIQLLPL